MDWLLGKRGRSSDEDLRNRHKAIARLRERAVSARARHRPKLSAALNDLALALAVQGRPAEALPVAHEAVAIERELAQAKPDEAARYPQGT